MSYLTFNGLNVVKILFFEWICREIVLMEFDENLGIQAPLPSWQSQLVIFTKSLFVIEQYSQLCQLVPYFHDFLSSAHMTLTVRSVGSVSFEVLIEQILCGENFMLIGPQENIEILLDLMVHACVIQDWYYYHDGISLFTQLYTCCW